MNTVKKSLLIALLVIYEILLADYAANNFSLARNWFTIVNSMPVSQSNVEFVIFLGQLPPIIVIGWLWSRKRQKEEEGLIKKYENNKNT